ncbi:hypothetical protein B0T09DRAFT_187657 [Sordaria sp. MPI-SDFR-AT-0083]|nr:hypothetical protein B0T09DRAFT_187657 [Sordaria sp. MPI-SDFR-AT-0083]
MHVSTMNDTLVTFWALESWRSILCMTTSSPLDEWSVEDHRSYKSNPCDGYTAFLSFVFSRYHVRVQFSLVLSLHSFLFVWFPFLWAFFFISSSAFWYVLLSSSEVSGLGVQFRPFTSQPASDQGSLRCKRRYQNKRGKQQGKVVQYFKMGRLLDQKQSSTSFLSSHIAVYHILPDGSMIHMRVICHVAQRSLT